jgi:hypothetical protein
LKNTLFCFVASSLFLFSCQKGITLDLPGTTPGSNASNFAGNYKFVNITASTLVINETFDGTDSTKTVTTSNYISENNAGTATFTQQSMAYSNMAYTINTVAKGVVYENGVLIDSITMPVQMSVPPTTAQASFTLITADSLSFPAGTPVIGGGQSTAASGARIKMEQNKLYLTQHFSESSTSTIQGIKIKELKQAKIVSLFQRL